MPRSQKRKETTKPKHPGGRPTLYSKELADKFCEEILRVDSKGNFSSIRKICSQERFPEIRTIYYWLKDKPEFLHQYTVTMNIRADLMADQTLEIAANDAKDVTINDEGEFVVNYENINRSKLRVSAMQWHISKHYPKKYRDSSSVEMSGPDGTAISPVQIYIPSNGREKKQDKKK